MEAEKRIEQGTIIGASTELYCGYIAFDNGKNVKIYSIFNNWDINIILNKKVIIEVVSHIFNTTTWYNHIKEEEVFHKVSQNFVTKIIEISEPKIKTFKYDI